MVILIVWIALFFCNRKKQLHLKFIQYQKSDKASFIIYADLECITGKIDGSKNNPENIYTAEVSEHNPSGFSLPTISSVRIIENKHNVCRGKGFMKEFCEYSRDHAVNIINFKNELIRKRAAGIIWKCKNLLYL